jgi:hypothetical protein
MKDLDYYTKKLCISESVKETLKSIESRKIKTKAGIHLVGDEKRRKLFNYEIEFFESINGLNDLTVIEASRLNKDYQIFHSKKYKKSEKSCSYLVRYVTVDNTEAFGFIEYFIKESRYNQIFAFIQHIDAESNDICSHFSPRDGTELKPTYSDLLNSGKLGYYYRVRCIVESRELIKAEDILNKCISVSLGTDEEHKRFIYVTDYDNENEHD